MAVLVIAPYERKFLLSSQGRLALSDFEYRYGLAETRRLRECPAEEDFRMEVFNGSTIKFSDI